MDTGFNTIEFYSGDISGNFATVGEPVGGRRRAGQRPERRERSRAAPTGPVQWQLGLGGDGFYARIDPVGTGTGLRYFVGNNSGGLSPLHRPRLPDERRELPSVRGALDRRHAVVHPPVRPLPRRHRRRRRLRAAGAPGGCGHLIGGTTRVWETITGRATRRRTPSAGT